MLASLASNIETEKKNLNKMARKIDHKLDKMEGIRMNINDGKSMIISQEEMKNDEDFGYQIERESKVSLKSSENFYLEAPINLNYNEFPKNKLPSIKEEDSPNKNQIDEVLKIQQKLQGYDEQNKKSLSPSLNQNKEDCYTSKIEQTVFESFEHSHRKGGGGGFDDQNAFNNTLLAEMKKNNKDNHSFSSSDSSHSQLDEPIGSPFGVLKNCDPVKKVIFFYFFRKIR